MCNVQSTIHDKREKNHIDATLVYLLLYLYFASQRTNLAVVSRGWTLVNERVQDIAESGAMGSAVHNYYY
jgi:hypothetical protein